MIDRIDISETIKRIDFPDKVWEWLDLFGDVVVRSQKESLYQEKSFLADTAFKKFLLCTINKDLSTLNAIYILLRCELIHQASSNARLFCESLVNTKYISLDSENRSNLFWDYADIEAYEISSSFLNFESRTAKPAHIERLKVFQNSLFEKYQKAKPRYSFVDRRGRKRSFSNWCNKSIAMQACECGTEFKRLYELVYKQMSSYIHGTPWSLRRQVFYSSDHYNADIILNDIALIIRTVLAVWIEWAKFCIDFLNWRLKDTIMEIPKRIEEMEARHFPTYIK